MIEMMVPLGPVVDFHGGLFLFPPLCKNPFEGGNEDWGIRIKKFPYNIMTLCQGTYIQDMQRLVSR